MQTLNLTPAQFKAALAGQPITAELDIDVNLGEVIHVAEAHTIEDMIEAIRALRVRGAPLIGISAAMGLTAAAAGQMARDQGRGGQVPAAIRRSVQ